jgi:hypothetical protein
MRVARNGLIAAMLLFAAFSVKPAYALTACGEMIYLCTQSGGYLCGFSGCGAGDNWFEMRCLYGGVCSSPQPCCNAEECGERPAGCGSW